MPHTKPWTVQVRSHPGSSPEEIRNEPDWASGHQHRIGFKNRQNRVPGITHSHEGYKKEIEKARHGLEELRQEAKTGQLINFRDLVEKQEDFHLQHPENRPEGWRYVLNATEDWVKWKQNWPANIKKREGKQEKENEQQQNRDTQASQEEHEWKRSSDKDKHHDAYATGNSQGDHDDQDVKDKYSPHELALLRAIEHERCYMEHLQENDGNQVSPQKKEADYMSMDEQDQFGPDNWVPRSSDLIRLTGKHPLNAEAHLTHLFEAGLITPNELHYVRNHGAVPRLLWEFHQLDIEYNGKMSTLSMDDLKSYKTINIPIALACDGNRRKELNMIKKSKGFNWGPGGVSCAYWKGPLLRDVLISVGVPEKPPDLGSKRYWVNFEGADEPSEGKYSTCIPFEYAMDPHNDVLLAYEMNDVPLPPDHGYPVRIMIPGYVGGRCVKWLRKICISEKENDSYYHIWDNRVLPAFVTERDGPFAETLFRHPSSQCNEQNLNSVIVKPAQGEKMTISEARKGRSYRVEGFAYDGGGHEVQRVELSLDDGETWLYCIRAFPDYPIRHGNKFWTWVHWHVDVELTHLLRSTGIAVRCFNVFKNTQPHHPNWNILGMMNNCWYKLKLEIVDPDDSDSPSILFKHPVDPGTGQEGWMKPSHENQIAQIKQEAGAPQKEFTREEIEKHDKEDDCWLVIDEKVYDATSVLKWHPGGPAAILSHAGMVRQETTDEFASIHDNYAYQKLKECALGVITKKAAQYIEENAKAAAKEGASNHVSQENIALQKHRWVAVKMIARREISQDTRSYAFQLPKGTKLLGLGTCQHVQIGFHMQDRMLIRSYTPTKPILPAVAGGEEVDGTTNGPIMTTSQRSLHDGGGTFELTVKTYFPNEDQPGGALSNILDCVPLGEEVEIRGTTGEIVYNGHGHFVIEGQVRHFDRISLVLGGSGITPGYSLIARIILTDGDDTQIRLINSNKTEADILLRDELRQLEEKSKGQLKIVHVLSHAGRGWKGLTGLVNQDIIRQWLFPPEKGSVALLCGPPAMIQKAVLPALQDWGYVSDQSIYGF